MKLSDRSKYVLNHTSNDTFIAAIVAVFGVIIYEGLRSGATWCLEQIGVQKYNGFWVPFIVFCVLMVLYSIYKCLDNGDNFDRRLKQKQRDQEEVTRRELAEENGRTIARATECALKHLRPGEIDQEDWKTRSPRL